ncbi:MAG TPA: acyltransferase [Anaerolineales bacterium]|nr:acyltransferase [Anaerolineales bacterium]
MSTRKYYLDWLRVLGILTVFVYHSTRFFNNEDWHVKNATWYPGLDAWNMFAVAWMMPLMFVISGASLFYALEKGGAGKFFKDKALRLLVPLLVVDLTHASMQVYLERLTHGQFNGSYFQFLPFYFQGIYDGSNPAAGNFALTGIHMWYVFWLFIFMAILYPLMRWLKGGGKRILSKISELLSLPGAVYALMLPQLLLLSFVDHSHPLIAEGEAGWPLIIYLWLVLCGFVVISNKRLLGSIQKLRWLSLVIAILSFVLYVFMVITTSAPVFGTGRFTLIISLRVFASWCMVLTLMGFAIQYLNRRTPFLVYGNEAVLPFYILHQSVLLFVGYFVVQWSVPDLLKWVVILLLALGLIMVIYEYLVRRFNVMRFLFGMKVIVPQPAAQTLTPEIAP